MLALMEVFLCVSVIKCLCAVRANLRKAFSVFTPSITLSVMHFVSNW